MKLALITTAIFSVSQAHHHRGRGRSTLSLVGRHDRLHELIEKLQANPPKCKNNETICEEPVNEYPRELVELLMKDFHIPEEMEYYSDYFDNRAKYFKWLDDQYQYQSNNVKINHNLDRDSILSRLKVSLIHTKYISSKALDEIYFV